MLAFLPSPNDDCFSFVLRRWLHRAAICAIPRRMMIASNQGWSQNHNRNTNKNDGNRQQYRNSHYLPQDMISSKFLNFRILERTCGMCFFPTCQVRVVRFYVSLDLLLFLLLLLPSSYCDDVLRWCVFSVACRTSTVIVGGQCCVSDPNCVGPQPRMCVQIVMALLVCFKLCVFPSWHCHTLWYCSWRLHCKVQVSETSWDCGVFDSQLWCSFQSIFSWL